MKFNNKNVYVSPKAIIGKNVKIGDNTTIYDNVVIGDNSIICNDCVIGEPTGQYYKDMDNYENPTTTIGENAMVRSHCIIYAGSVFGANLITGHRVTIREKAVIGRNCLISTLVDIQGNCSIGDYSRIYSNVHIGELTKIGNYVMIFPYSIFTNDPQPPSNQLIGSEIGDYSIITIHCCVLPGVKVGKHCLIGANSVLSRDIEDFSFAMGSPAKKLKDIRTIPSKIVEGAMHYPWPFNFERGMPWEGQDYNEWLNHNIKE
ncbi:MAG: DapH/DapD/GlmU-related protein [Phycisphaerales bacterium]|nr:DapH/DapD/GlmU-related protein [Phycisphaerales bacterium]